jgi:hypothetical protein
MMNPIPSMKNQELHNMNNSWCFTQVCSLGFIGQDFGSSSAGTGVWISGHSIRQNNRFKLQSTCTKASRIMPKGILNLSAMKRFGDF